MSEPTLSDIDFKNKMVWVWITLNSHTLTTPKFLLNHWYDDLWLLKNQALPSLSFASSLIFKNQTQIRINCEGDESLNESVKI